MKYQFVLWGYGKRGKRFMEICPHKYLAAIIEHNFEGELQGLNVPIISYEEYKEKYKKYEIVISPYSYEEIIMQLEQDGIYTYHLLADCPPEIIGFSGRRWIDELPINIDKQHNYVIFGLNLYSILLREFLSEKLGKAIDIIPDNLETERVKEFLKNKDFVTDRKPLPEETVLWATRYHYEKFNPEYCEDVFDFSGKIKEYRNEEIEHFKGKHSGERCFIVATGPSMRTSDLDVLKKHKCKCFSMNRIYLAFEQTDWRPDYYVATDDRVLSEYADDIIKCPVENKFISDTCADFWTRKADYHNMYRFHEHLIDIFPNLPFFAENVENSMYFGGTVVYECIQLACYMGFKEIYLIGTDHNYSGSTVEKVNHFHKDYYNKLSKPNNYVREKAEVAFEAAKRYADRNGIKIYNATRGGNLEVFGRVNFDELFE